MKNWFALVFPSMFKPKLSGRGAQPSRKKKTRHSVAGIVTAVAAEHGITAEAINGRSRSKNIAAARRDAIALAAQLHPEMSSVELGRAFGLDHTTILYALRKSRESGKPLPDITPTEAPRLEVATIEAVVGPANQTPHSPVVSMNVDTFCNLYAVRRNLAYDEMKSGRLKFKKVGRRTIIRKVDADEWLDNLPIGNLSNRASSA